MASKDKRHVEPLEFARRSREQYGKDSRAIAKALGDPPDVKNVPKKTWKESEDRHKAELFLLIFGAGLIALTVWYLWAQKRKSGDRIRPIEDLEKELEKEARKRANWAAGKVSQTSRKQVKKAATEARRTIEEAEARAEWTGAQKAEAKRNALKKMRERMSKTFGDSRAETVARTESTQAASIAIEIVRKELERVREDGEDGFWLIWQLQPCDHCRICPTLHRTDQTFWREFTPHPPLHVNCCCELHLFEGSREKALESGLIRLGDRERTLQAMREDAGLLFG